MMGVLLVLHEQVDLGPKERTVLARLFDQAPSTTAASFVPRFVVFGFPTGRSLRRFSFAEVPNLAWHGGHLEQRSTILAVLSTTGV